MKPFTSILFLILFSFADAQLQLLDEPLGDGRGDVLSLAVYDNDILYTMNRVANSRDYSSFLSNGVPGRRINILPNQNDIASFHATVGDDGVRLYNFGNYKAGNKIFADVVSNGHRRVLELNASRSLLIPNNIFKKTSGEKNIFNVANGGVISIDTVEVNNTNRLVFRYFLDNGEIHSYRLPESLYGAEPLQFLNWNNELHYVMNFLGERDLYKSNALFTNRVTQNKVSKPTAFKGVSPRSFLLDDYIYFIGREGYYTSNFPNPPIRNYPVWVSYTNGDIDFGSLDTYIYDGDDGSLGYKAYTNTDHPNNIIGKVGGQLIYYSRSDGNNFYSLPNKEDLGIPPPPTTNDFKYVEHNDKLYILLSRGYPNYYNSLYIVDGFASGTSEVLIQPYLDNHTPIPARKISRPIAMNNKIYFLARYQGSEERYQLLSYTPGASDTVVEFVFPNDVFPNTNYLIPYNNGFVLRAKNGKFSSKEQIYTLNVEIRALVVDPLNPDNTSMNSNAFNVNNTHSATFTYNNVDYDVELNTISTATDDKLKVQLLDYTSNQFKHEITSLPTNENADNISKVFYAINTLKDSNSFSANVTFAYDDAMFSQGLSNPQNMSFLVYSNNNWTEINASAIDTVSGLITLELTNAPNEVFVFIKTSDNNLSTQRLALEKNDEINIYPNPTDGLLHINSKETITRIKLFSVGGQQIKEINNQNTIDLSSLPKGIYLARIETEHQVITKKVIKE